LNVLCYLDSLSPYKSLLKLQVAKMRGKKYLEQKAILSFVFTYFCKIYKYSYGHG